MTTYDEPPTEQEPDHELERQAAAEGLTTRHPNHHTPNGAPHHDTDAEQAALGSMLDSLNAAADIIDTGLTLHKMKEKLTEMGATDVVAVCMLRRHLETPRWVRFGLTLPESCGFVAGMGLDYNHKHRDLDGIYEMK